MNANALSVGSRRRGAGIVQVLLACTTATATDAAPLLRKGYAAVAEELSMTPTSLAKLPPAGKFEAMLICGALESAALALLPCDASFMLSRGANGRHLGSVFMPECGEHTVEGITAALALMAATLLAWRDLLRAQAGEPARLH